MKHSKGRSQGKIISGKTMKKLEDYESKVRLINLVIKSDELKTQQAYDRLIESLGPRYDSEDIRKTGNSISKIALNSETRKKLDAKKNNTD